jgi:HlyD family secretion protein
MSADTIPSPPGIALGDLARRIPRWLILVGAAVAIVAVAALIVAVRSRTTISYATQPIVRQTLVQSVTASGTVNPQNTVSVGTQVSGTISALYVDFNSKVKAGEVLARIDPSTFNSQLDQSNAALAQAQAQTMAAGANANASSSGVNVATANAAAQVAATTAVKTNIAKAQAALTLAQSQEQRDQTLFAQGYLPQETVQTDQSTVAQDQAAVASAQAAYIQAQAQSVASNATVGQSGSSAQALAANVQAAQATVSAAQATVAQSQLNLQHTIITSPVNGTVVARDISVGQTVAASLSAPTLFAIAQDLSKMEVDINVGEPDIGGIKAGNQVNFTVLAYPNQTFAGKVTQVRINPQTLNNVVTYDVVVDVANPKGTLLPGMTANATIDTASVTNALIVPLAALQFGLASGYKSHAAGSKSGTSPWGQTLGAGASASGATTTGVVFVDRGGKLLAEHVNVLLANSTQAAVSVVAGSALNVGDLVVVGTSASETRTAAVGANRPPSLGGSSSNAARGIH